MSAQACLKARGVSALGSELNQTNLTFQGVQEVCDKFELSTNDNERARSSKSSQSPQQKKLSVSRDLWDRKGKARAVESEGKDEETSQRQVEDDHGASYQLDHDGSYAKRLAVGEAEDSGYSQEQLEWLATTGFGGAVEADGNPVSQLSEVVCRWFIYTEVPYPDERN